MEYDVIVVGSGVAGLTSAALLAKEFGKKVLVLERAPFIGGRLASFVGVGQKVEIDGLELDATGMQKALGVASTHLFSSEPPIEEVFERGLLDGYTYEAGGHGLFWGNRSRIAHLLGHVGEHVEIPCNVGFGFVDHEHGNVPYQVGRGQPYPWMSEEAFASTMNAMRAMGRMSVAEVARYKDVSLEDWLRQFDLHPQAYDYIKALSASQTAQADLSMTPAADFLYYMAMAKDIRMNLVDGSCGTVDRPGAVAIAQALERVIRAAGGEVRRSTTVTEVLVEGGRVEGVRMRGDGGTETARAATVFLNMMPKQLFHVLDRSLFPPDLVETIEQRYWGAGLLTAFIGLTRDIWAERGIDERSFIFLPGAIRNEGFIGDVDVVVWAMGACAPTRAPAGKRSFEFSIGLTDQEMHSRERVGRIKAWCENWFKETFPGVWERDVEFCIWTPAPDAYGQWRPVGEERLDNRSPYVNGLYLVGDQYGKRLLGGGVDGATLSGVMAVDSLMGSNLEQEIFPPYHQGIPKDL